VPLGSRNRIDAVAFDLAKGIRRWALTNDFADGSSLRWHYPVQVHAVGARRALSARSPELPLEMDFTSPSVGPGRG
jgi:hypothetical protein